MSRVTLTNFLYTTLGGTVVWIVSLFDVRAAVLVITACAVCIYLCVRLYKFDYLHPSLAYLIPWLLILIFSVVPISSHARPIEKETYALLLSNMFAWMLGCVISRAVSIAPDSSQNKLQSRLSNPEFKDNYESKITWGFFLLYAFALINIMIAGYIPIISLITTGDSRYWEFGVPSVYGAFLAYANSAGCIAFYSYLRVGRTKYLLFFLSVLAMHFAFVTRQNLVTLLLEAFIIRSIVTTRFTRFTLLWSIALTLIAFSALGTLRSGDIKEIIGVQPEYNWVPTSLIWVYAYSYFNALNLDNTIAFSGAPFFDGYMWQTLLPTVLRPDVDHGTYLEITSMNVSSYVYPVYLDIGKGVVIWTFLIGLITSVAYCRALTLCRFVDVATYSCLYFCAFLSFFTDCWLYLPIIFQLFFFFVFHLLLFQKRRLPAHAEELVEA